MKLVVTGAGGLLGSHLIGLLAAQQDVEVVAVTSQDPALAESLWVARAQAVAVAPVSVVRTEDLLLTLPTLREVDWFINCAFPRGRSGRELGETLDFHQSLFSEARRVGVRSLINISSQSVYGESRTMAADEGTPISLETPYAAAKYATEVLARIYFAGASFTNLRLASLLSPYFALRVVNRMVARALKGEEISVTMASQVFDFMDVRDAASAIVSIVRSGIEVGTETLNVGSNNPVTLAELAQKCVEASGERSGVVSRITVTGETEDAPSSALDARELQRVYGFSAEYSLERTILDIVDQSIR